MEKNQIFETVCATGHNQCTGCYYCEEKENKYSCWFLKDARWLIDWAIQTCEYQKQRYGTVCGEYRWYYGKKEVIETSLDYPLFYEKKFWDLWKLAKAGLKRLGFGIFKDNMDNFILFFDVSKIDFLLFVRTWIMKEGVES